MKALKTNNEIHMVCKCIANELVRIWELWDLEKGGYGYYSQISDDYEERVITFMQRGCMGDGPSEAYWLFKHKTKWIHVNINITRNDIADPESFLSKHRKYRQEYDKYIQEETMKVERNKKEERREEFEKLKKEFGAKENGR